MFVELKKSEFEQISRLIHRSCGIYLKPGKEALVRARLVKRLRALGLARVADYLDLLERPEGEPERIELVDAMTTNKTSFFREARHFEFLQREVLPNLAGDRLRFWCAACSSGEEPYSLAMVLLDALPRIAQRDVLILATDISGRMLDTACRAVYGGERLNGLPGHFVNKYLTRVNGEQGSAFRVGDRAQALVRFGRLNLVGPWPMKGPFQAVFCRNVMIYFDRTTQQQLIDRIWEYLEPGGYLFVGHSEGLAAIAHRFEYVRPAIYRK